MPNETDASGAQVPCISLLAQLVDELLSHIDYHDSHVKPENRVTSQVQIVAWRKRKADALANNSVRVDE